MSKQPDMHPEDRIYAVKTFIKELENVQDERFEKLVEDLKITDARKKELLFDYVFNCTDEITFEEFLEKY